MGSLNHRFGKKNSLEHIEAMMKPIRGVPMSFEQKKKIGLANKGKKRTPEFGRLISSMKKGKTSFFKGRTGRYTPETIIKMKIARHKLGSFAGERNPKWNGGVSKLHKTTRQLFMETLEYNLWHDAVMARDNWTCQKYGTVGGKLCVHHIRNYQDYPELRTSIENGITLSDVAHKEFHSRYGNRNTTKEQLVAFLSEARCDKIINRTGLNNK
jgi:hypothetical protein